MSREDIESEIGEVVNSLLRTENIPMNTIEKSKLIVDIVDELLGYGPIEPLLKDPSVNDILVNTFNQVYVERNGLLELTDVKFRDDGNGPLKLAYVSESFGQNKPGPKLIVLVYEVNKDYVPIT